MIKVLLPAVSEGQLYRNIGLEILNWHSSLETDTAMLSMEWKHVY